MLHKLGQVQYRAINKQQNNHLACCDLQQTVLAYYVSLINLYVLPVRVSFNDQNIEAASLFPACTIYLFFTKSYVCNYV